MLPVAQEAINAITFCFYPDILLKKFYICYTLYNLYFKVNISTTKTQMLNTEIHLSLSDVRSLKRSVTGTRPYSRMPSNQR